MLALLCIPQPRRRHPTYESSRRTSYTTKTSKSFAFTASKGSDTILLLQWLRLECGLAIQKHAAHRRVDLLKAALQVTRASNLAFWMLYNHGLWIPRHCMCKLRDTLLRVVRGFGYLAQGCYQEKFAAYRCKSTLHSIHHFAVEIDIALQVQASCYPNPLLFDCSQSEDFVGRNARVARATHGKTTALRSLQRHLVKSRAMLRKHFGTRPRQDGGKRMRAPGSQLNQTWMYTTSPPQPASYKDPKPYSAPKDPKFCPNENESLGLWPRIELYTLVL